MTLAGSLQGLDDSSRQYLLCFRVGNQWYAIDVQYVFEVAQMVTISGVPDMPEAIRGVVNVRGSIVPVLDLRIRFNMPTRNLDLTTPIIFIQHDDNAFGLIADDIDDVFQVHEGMIRPTELRKRADHIVGLIEHRSRLTTIIDPLVLLATSLQGQNFDELTAKIPDSLD